MFAFAFENALLPLEQATLQLKPLFALPPHDKSSTKYYYKPTYLHKIYKKVGGFPLHPLIIIILYHP